MESVHEMALDDVLQALGRDRLQNKATAVRVEGFRPSLEQRAFISGGLDAVGILQCRLQDTVKKRTRSSEGTLEERLLHVLPLKKNGRQLVGIFTRISQAGEFTEPPQAGHCGSHEGGNATPPEEPSFLNTIGLMF